MKATITLNEEEIFAVVQGLDMLFDDCNKNRDWIGCLEEEEIDMFKDAMVVGRTLERFVDLYRENENHAEKTEAPVQVPRLS